MTSRSFHYEQDGTWIHKKKVWREAKKLGITEKEHAEALGLLRIEEDEKFIFNFLFKRKEQDFGFIYKVTFPHGKLYIGQTVNSIDLRLKRHILDAKNNSPLLFHVALRKYDYKVEIDLIEKVSSSELIQREQYWISYYDTTNKEKGYNDPNASLFFIDRVPEDVLFRMLDLRKLRWSYKEIAEKFGVSSGFVNAVIWGRMRPEIKSRWLDDNDELDKQKTVEDTAVLRMFQLHDEGKTQAEIAKEMDVTKTYVSNVFQGKQRADLKDEYELETGKPFVARNSKTVDRELAKTIIHEKYSTGVTSVTLAEKHGLSVDQVRDIVTGTTAKEVYEEYKKIHKITKNFKYSDDKLLLAFDMRFTQGMLQRDVAKQLGIDKSFLSMLFNGKNRIDVKEQWEAKNGPVPSKSEIKSQAGKKKS